MLITFSGIVGSGKSTNAKTAHRSLRKMRYPAAYFRFRFLDWRKIFQPLQFDRKKAPAAARHSPGTSKQAPQSAHELRKQNTTVLTFARFLVYLWRILMFRAFVSLRLRRAIGICDRFFYDSFVHYHLTRKRERFYFRILKRILPTPDLALMFVAQPKNIIERRRHYDPEYLLRLSGRYATIIREFPNITVIHTDEFDGLDAIIAAQLQKAVAANGRWNSRRFEVRFSSSM